MKILKLTVLGGLILTLLAACDALPFRAEPTPEIPAFPTGSTELQPVPATGSSCLVGEWALEEEELAALQQLAEEAAGQDLIIEEISGDLVAQFLPDGTLVGYAQGVSLEGRAPFNGVRVPAAVTVNGSTTGTYSADDEAGRLTLTLQDASDMRVTARVLILPVFNRSLQTFVNERDLAGSSLDVDFDCSGDRLEFSFESFDGNIETVRLQRVSD